MVTTRSTLILNPEDDGATESPALGAWPQIGDRAAKMATLMSRARSL
jgi:hypothetical protein